MTIIQENYADMDLDNNADAATDDLDNVTPDDATGAQDSSSNNIDKEDDLWQDEKASEEDKKKGEAKDDSQKQNDAYQRAVAGIHNYALQRAESFVNAEELNKLVEEQGAKGMAAALRNSIAAVYEATITDAHKMMYEMIQQAQARMGEAQQGASRAEALDNLFEAYPELGKAQYKEYATLAYDRALSKGLRGKKAQDAVINHLKKVMPAAVKTPNAPTKTRSRNDSVWDALDRHFA